MIVDVGVFSLAAGRLLGNFTFFNAAVVRYEQYLFHSTRSFIEEYVFTQQCLLDIVKLL